MEAYTLDVTGIITTSSNLIVDKLSILKDALKGYLQTRDVKHKSGQLDFDFFKKIERIG